MSSIIHEATVLNRYRAAALDREVEHLRRQAERRAFSDATDHPTGFAVVTAWFGETIHGLRPAAPPRVATHH